MILLVLQNGRIKRAYVKLLCKNRFDKKYITRYVFITQCVVNHYVLLSDLIKTSQIWIGPNDLLQEGIFVAPNSMEVVPYVNWTPNNPNNGGDGEGQHCAAIYRDHVHAQWDDNDCHSQLNPLCQR